MKTAPILSVAGISLAAALVASAVVITPPPTPPPFAPVQNSRNNRSGNGTLRAGQSPGSVDGMTSSAQVQPPPALPPPAPPPTRRSMPAQTPAQAPAAIVPTSRTELFNGEDFTGWQFVMANGANATATWFVADGVIKTTGRPNGYARTTQAYKDYQVTVEWRFLPGQTGSVNTGVVVHVTPPETMNPWPKCIECQGRHTSQGDFWFWNDATCKELVSLPADQIMRQNPRNGIRRQGADAEKPVGEWNTFTVICRGNTVAILVNGKEVNKITETNLNSGYIGLQSEGGPVEIRKVTLEPLPAEQAAQPAAAARGTAAAPAPTPRM